MSLPRFFPRVNDSIGPLLSARADVKAFLADKSVSLQAPTDLEQHHLHVAGFLLLANLCARFYPRIHVDASPRIAEEVRAVVLKINPTCEVSTGAATTSVEATLAWCSPATPSADTIVVAPLGWEVLIDLPDSGGVHNTNMLASLAAAAIGAGATFRRVFGELLPQGRRSSEPGRFNILTHGPTAATLPDLPPDIPLGRIHLVGAGAVGQAAIYALARVSATGAITVVDPEGITLSNLQRYVLTFDTDEGLSKCAIAERALVGTRLECVGVEGEWSADLLETRSAEVICAAVDTEDVRIGLQASLPRRVYNAWTQPADIGWSRHEQFGVEPCAACLYWPTGTRPSYHELVARALRQHELRVLAHLSFRLPVDVPLLPGQIPKLAEIPAPPDVSAWLARSLLDDVAVALEINADELASWRGRSIQDLYREGICGGALVRAQFGDVPTEMAVPLAHQSVLAGIMLATQLIVAAHPELRPFRSEGIEARLDLLAPFPQIAVRPRQRTPGCICSDPDFIGRYRTKWPWPLEQVPSLSTVDEKPAREERGGAQV